MTYDAIEKSQRDARPVEFYRFASGSRLWLQTSADKELVIPAGTFSPEFLEREPIEHSDEDLSGSLDVVVAVDHPVAALFAAYFPEDPVALTIYAAHRQELANAVVVWAGTVSQCNVEGAEARLTCVPDDVALGQKFPTRVYSAQCQWPLYGPGCGADPTSKTDPVNVTTVSGFTVTSADFALRPNGWYTNGWLRRASGERRMVVSHSGSTVALKARFRELFSGEIVSAIAGCQRRYQLDCVAKFANGINFGGYAWMPKRNPYDGRIL